MILKTFWFSCKKGISSVIDGAGITAKLAAASGVNSFILDGHTYAAVTSYDDASIVILQITKDKTSSNNRLCGVSADCSPPSISKHGTATASVPDWVKNTAGWWADGQISENEFVNAIEHLVKTGTIIVI